MNDKTAVLIGIAILILGLSVYLTPIKYEMLIELLPMSVIGIVILALGTVVLIIGFISVVVEKL